MRAVADFFEQKVFALQASKAICSLPDGTGLLPTLLQCCRPGAQNHLPALAVLTSLCSLQRKASEQRCVRMRASIYMHKMSVCSMWPDDNEQILRQLPGVGPLLSRSLFAANVRTFADVRNSTERRLEEARASHSLWLHDMCHRYAESELRLDARFVHLRALFLSSSFLSRKVCMPSMPI